MTHPKLIKNKQIMLYYKLYILLLLTDNILHILVVHPYHLKMTEHLCDKVKQLKL